MDVLYLLVVIDLAFFWDDYVLDFGSTLYGYISVYYLLNYVLIIKLYYSISVFCFSAKEELEYTNAQ